eukprot:3056448-Amphidinium_carterae.1
MQKESKVIETAMESMEYQLLRRVSKIFNKNRLNVNKTAIRSTIPMSDKGTTSHRLLVSDVRRKKILKKSAKKMPSNNGI